MKYYPAVLSFSLLAACSTIPPEAYYNRGDPENLLDISSEVVTLGLGSPRSLSQLSSMVAEEPPAHAELSCAAGDTVCMQAKEILDQNNVPVEFAGNDNSVTLTYERVIARDCENRFIDNSINPYNLSHPTFGCSVMANTVQMVSDKKQFTSPDLLDLHDGEKAVQNYREYLNPTSGEQQGGFTLQTGSAGSGGTQ